MVTDVEMKKASLEMVRVLAMSLRNSPLTESLDYSEKVLKLNESEDFRYFLYLGIVDLFADADKFVLIDLFWETLFMKEPGNVQGDQQA